MINKIFFMLIVLFSIAFSQGENKIITDTESGEPMLIGYCTREAFNDSSFSGWWNSEYDTYVVDSIEIDKLKQNLNDFDITIVMATWCSDSKREVPRFYKILDEINYFSDSVIIICVDRDKHMEGNEIDSLEIELVPTFIFYRDEKEIGRIMEMPDETLETDMINIFNKSSFDG